MRSLHNLCDSAAQELEPPVDARRHHKWSVLGKTFAPALVKYTKTIFEADWLISTMRCFKPCNKVLATVCDQQTHCCQSDPQQLLCVWLLVTCAPSTSGMETKV
jgi:hypothetical protein